jgi:hypothetical protein
MDKVRLSIIMGTKLSLTWQILNILLIFLINLNTLDTIQTLSKRKLKILAQAKH